ncbi:hypothetical protein BGZ61DRAFT_475084 [Ilyonectria robusta]|uniref:uncharacterized protein n=1 Tax=Ilyonectria robusta TaxID=1079257 RepID=UPI001E8DB55D|nr:uncharacterized protein BGZ61DRAFT_475084 [Ilyonectria robusta]KAH8729467.1 hypothetical protein BGZ61DRAFT_475084 [Ilyonectria robusta]
MQAIGKACFASTSDPVGVKGPQQVGFDRLRLSLRLPFDNSGDNNSNNSNNNNNNIATTTAANTLWLRPPKNFAASFVLTLLQQRRRCHRSNLPIPPLELPPADPAALSPNCVASAASAPGLDPNKSVFAGLRQYKTLIFDACWYGAVLDLDKMERRPYGG